MLRPSSEQDPTLALSLYGHLKQLHLTVLLTKFDSSRINFKQTIVLVLLCKLAYNGPTTTTPVQMSHP